MVGNFKPIGSKIFGRMKDNNLLLNNEIDSEFLMLISNPEPLF